MRKLFSLSLIFFTFILVSCSSDTTNQNSTDKDNAENNNVTTAANNNTPTGEATNNNTAVAAPETDSKKKALLKKMIGTHKLKAIEGLSGVNTMMEYNLNDGKWSASESSNVGGEREAYDIELSADQLSLLNTMQLTVKDDLTIVLSSKDTDHFSVTYQEKGMAYKAQGEISGGSIPKELNAETDFFGDSGNLYLYLKAGTEDDVKSINITEIFADAVALNVDGSTGNFVLTVFNSECCDEASYTFKKN
ncbi:MAG: hypothetical protein MK212_07805 [Saprospiraceae bacterium]|nr:hypothetical protein [Saprospiraceae bacterium]